jgi:hypothetical protein
MKKSLYLLILLATSIGLSQDLSMQDGTFNRCEPNVFYDSGGPSGSYSSDENFAVSEPLPDPDIVINEIMYHPVSDVESEWIEIYNPNDFSISLDGFSMRDGGAGNHFTLHSAVIDEKGYLVVAGDVNDFSAQFSGLQNVVGGFNSGDLGFNLSNAGETVYLYDLNDEIEDSVAYFDNSPWPVLADGFGPSLQLISPDLNNNVGGSWTTNNVHYATPGRSNNINDVEAGMQHEAADLFIYPNPAKEFVILKIDKSQDFSFVLCDLTGRIIEKKDVVKSETEINLNYLDPSVYILKILKDNEEVKTFKIIKL